ncbi:abortive infection family protein (plasmid) [Cereibacter azotoformans]|uniref:abortive infection family protein n=1 Tax=Cereibacter azotoformans TaxID=43057 RepID=UPI003B20FC6A
MSKRKNKTKLPDGITDDPELFARFKVDLAEIVARSMNASDWKKFAIRFGLEDEISNHPRFLRSLQWSDDDYEGHVVDLVELLCSRNIPAVEALFQIPNVQKGLDEEIIAAWNGEQDPLVSALSHSLAEVNAARDWIDLSTYTARVEDALPHDPHRAVGATKELLEAAMRSILDGRGIANVDKLEFPELTNTCFTQLGLLPVTPPRSKVEGKIRKIADNAKKMVIACNELRNIAGTGHGRVVGTEEELSADDASLVASSGMILSAWLLRHAEKV